MPRPQNKEALLLVANTNYTTLIKIVNSFSRKEQVAEYYFDNNRDKNLRDILTHLHHWHLMLLEWHKKGIKGEVVQKPALGYTWKTLPDWNKIVWKMYQSTDFDTAIKLLEKSHKDVLSVIKSYTNDDLFEKKKYKWTGTTSMGAYFISATSSHYDWAIKHLKKYNKSIKGKELFKPMSFNS